MSSANLQPGGSADRGADLLCTDCDANHGTDREPDCVANHLGAITAPNHLGAHDFNTDHDSPYNRCAKYHTHAGAD